jgi:hypothetical protein
VNYCWYISCFSDVFIKYFRELGLETSSIVDNVLEELFELSLRMFDTRLPPRVTVLSPFAEDSSLTKVGVEVCDCIICICPKNKHERPMSSAVVPPFITCNS